MSAENKEGTQATMTQTADSTSRPSPILKNTDLVTIAMELQIEEGVPWQLAAVVETAAERFWDVVAGHFQWRSDVRSKTAFLGVLWMLGWVVFCAGLTLGWLEASPSYVTTFLTLSGIGVAVPSGLLLMRWRRVERQREKTATAQATALKEELRSASRGAVIQTA